MNEEEQYQKTLKKIRNGVADAKEKKQSYYEDRITFPANVRHSFIRGGDVLVVHDVPITKVGLQVYHDQNGQAQIHFKTPEAVSQIRSDFSPLAYTHPTQQSGGSTVALHFREMTNEQVRDWMIGWSSDGYYDEKTQKRYADLYFNVPKLKTDRRGLELIDRITKNKSTDVSIGFYVETVDEKGTFNGKQYDVKQVAIDYDHTAVLVEQQGRYSYPDGVGIGADTSETKRGGEQMGEPTNGNTPAAADVLAGKLADSDKARQDAEARATAALKEAEKAKADLKELQDKAAKAESDAHIKRVDAFVAKMKDNPLGKAAKTEDWKDFLSTLSPKQMDFVEKNLGDVQLLRDNRVAIAPGSNSNAQAGDKVDYLQKARDASEARWKQANGIAVPAK